MLCRPPRCCVPNRPGVARFLAPINVALAYILQENILAAGGRLKRKALSPKGKSGPLAKRSSATALTTTAPRSAAAAVASSARAPASAGDDGTWEAVAADMGWTLADCLGHKLAFAKRADAKAKVEVLAAHVKRLRAAGWHLLDARDRACAEAADAGACAAAEAAGRREDREAADAALQEVQAQLGAATAVTARAEEALAEQRAQVPCRRVRLLMAECGRQLRWPVRLATVVYSGKQARCMLASIQRQRAAEVSLRCHGDRPAFALQVEKLQGQLAGARDSLQQAQQAERSAAAEAQRLREQAEELQAQSKALSEMQQQAQTYNAQLQEYNARMQKELQVCACACVRVRTCVTFWCLPA